MHFVKKHWLIPLAAAPALLVLVEILRLRPFFGLMDDAGLMQLALTIRQNGLLHTTLDYARGDLAWGMFRPFYPAMTWLLYGTAGDRPLVLFVLNYFLAAACLLALGFAFFAAYQARLARPWRAPLERGSLVALYFLAVLAFPWTHDLFLHPSLQEKLVLVAGAGALVWFARGGERLHPFPRLALSAVILAAGFSTKAQFIIFVPVILALVVNRAAAGRLPRAEAAAIFALSIAFALALKWIAANGSYTGKFGATHSLHHLKKPVVTALIGCALISMAMSWRMLEKRTLWAWLVGSLPALMIFSYLAIFLQWGIEGYLLSSIGSAVAMTAALLGTCMRGKWNAIYSAALVLASLGISAYRSEAFFSRLGDIGRIVSSPEIERIASERAQVYMNCEEGAGAMQFYVKHFRGLDVRILPAPKEGMPPGSYLIGDTKLCPAQGGGRRLVLAGRRAGGFCIFR